MILSPSQMTAVLAKVREYAEEDASRYRDRVTNPSHDGLQNSLENAERNSYDRSDLATNGAANVRHWQLGTAQARLIRLTYVEHFCRQLIDHLEQVVARERTGQMIREELNRG